MKKNLLIIALAVLFLVGWTVKPQPDWEYKMVFAPTEKKVNEVASQGWELVAVDTNTKHYIFKRAK